MTVLPALVATTTTDQGTDSVSSARADIADAISKLNLLINHARVGSSVIASGTGQVDVGSENAGIVRVNKSGSPTITGLGNPGASAAHVMLSFTSGIVLEHSASFVLPGDSDITTAEDDFAFAIWSGSLSGWLVRAYWPGRLQIATVAEIRAGNVANKTVTVDNLTAAQVPVSLSSGSSLPWNMQSGINFVVGQSSNFTVQFPSNPIPGRGGRLQFFVSSGGPYTIGWASGFVSSSGSFPDVLSANMIVPYYCENASTILVS